MSQLVNWEYYSSLFEKVKESEFKNAEKLAEKEVCAVIGAIRWAEITAETFGYEQLQDCICKTIDKMAENAESGIGKGISSVSNDGYSESYVIQTEEQLRRELHSSINSQIASTISGRLSCFAFTASFNSAAFVRRFSSNSDNSLKTFS